MLPQHVAKEIRSEEAPTHKPVQACMKKIISRYSQNIRKRVVKNKTVSQE